MKYIIITFTLSMQMDPLHKYIWDWKTATQQYTNASEFVI